MSAPPSSAAPRPPTYLADLTTESLKALLVAPKSCVLVPVGSVEPHGPHLPLATDAIISETACARAASTLADAGIVTVIAPALPYGVTDYAAGFKGAIGVSAPALTALLRDVVSRLSADGFTHVCLVNNHLEPAHDAAVRAAIRDLPPGVASVACPLDRRHGRTLSDEFKSGACHAGRYETSLVLASKDATKVSASYKSLAPLDLSLSKAIASGQKTFAEIGMSAAYTGAPAEATADEGRDLYERLARMIVIEVEEGIERRAA